MDKLNKPKTYKDSGVDIDRADQFVEKIKPFVKKTLISKVKLGIGGFAALYEISKDQYLAACTDGVGTKVKLASELNQHQGIGQDLVAMCVNDLICVGAQPLFFLDYFATGHLNLKVGCQIIKSIAKACYQCGISLIGGETAEMPQVYDKDTYDLAGFLVGIVNKKHLIIGNKINSGDLIIGLPSNGAHSNGYSLIRQLFSTNETNWMKLALRPTILYSKSVLDLHYKKPYLIKGIAHITGSGFLNIPRINENFDYHIYHRPNLPKILSESIRRAHLTDQEAYKTFNMGVGMILITSPKNQNLISDHFKKYQLNSILLGEVQKGKGRVFLKFNPHQEIIL